jgi:hypothetical protein
VRERFVDADVIVLPAERPRKPGARRRQGFEAELGKQPRAARVPRIRDHEATGLVQLTESCDAI